MTDVLKDCVFAMKRLSDYTAGLIEPYKQGTIRRATESFSNWTARCQEKRDRDINTLIESLFFFINSEQERSKDSKRMDWIEKNPLVDLIDNPDELTMREWIDEAIARETASTQSMKSENQTSLSLGTGEGPSKTESSESSQDE